MLDCLIPDCGRKGFKDNRGLGCHLKTHGMTLKEYRSKYPKPEKKQADSEVAKKETSSADTSQLSEQNIEDIADSIFKRFQTDERFQMNLQKNPPELPAGVQRITGMEEVEVIGEKVNYKIALSPDIFWRFNVFKAQNMRLASAGKAQMFQGDLSDFLDLATKNLLSHYGMYPTVMTLSGGKMLVELPTGEES